MKIVIIINKARLTTDLQLRLLSDELRVKYGIQYDTFFLDDNEFDATLKK